MRPTTLIALMIVVGVVAALPFRRAANPAGNSDTPANLPSTDPVRSVTSADGTWGRGSGFDPSLAWQPLPMSIPGNRGPELPPMPDSYYDVSFEIQQPQPIRDRFPAAVNGAGFPASGFEPATGVAEFLDPDRWVTRRPPVSANVSANVPSAHEPLSREPLPDKVAVEDLITDRFVYTPLAKPEQAGIETAAQGGAVFTPAQSASLSRSLTPRPSDAERPKYFIREPD